MLFNSWQYVVFLPLVVLGYYLLPQRLRWVWLLAASYYFYMSANAKLVFLLLATTLTSWGAALLIERSATQGRKRLWLFLAAGVSLGLLFFFKYFNFFSVSLARVLAVFGLPMDPVLLSVLLPVGISFYTFQTLGYVIDVYNGAIPAEKHPGIYALFVSFFPLLLAGPIERGEHLLPQLREKHTPQPAAFSWGLRLICWGLLKKVAIADTLARYVNAVYAAPGGFVPMAQLLATVLFAIQLFCDFSGYTDIARGSAALLGFNLVENFRAPYLARSIREFWQRWHISLSSWLQDYVFTPLVWSRWTEKLPLIGKRVKKPPVLSSFVITFLVSGLWHGAQWTFVVWGLYHGVLTALGTLLAPARKKLEGHAKSKPAKAALAAAQTVFTLALVCLGFVFFRAQSLSQALGILAALPAAFVHPAQGLASAFAALGMGAGVLLRIAFGAALLLVFDLILYRGKDPFDLLARQKAPLRVAVTYGLALVLLAGALSVPEGTVMSFIYFQF